MRALTIISGMILLGVGIFSIANSGLAFISLAFVIGIALIISGVSLVLSYRRINDEREENVHWVLVEGFTSCLMGIIMLTGYLTADVAVQAVFGLWTMISGIRTMAVYLGIEIKGNYKFYINLAVAGLELVIGLLSFFNFEFLSMSVLFIVGFCVLIQGFDSIRIGMDMGYKKPEVIKTKKELVDDAKRSFESAKADVQEAIQLARDAKENLKEVIEKPSVEQVIEKPIEYESNKND